MADTNTDTSTTDGTSNNGKRKKGGLLTFIKKNKTLSAVVGGIGGYLLYKMNKEKSEGGAEGEPAGEVTAVAAEGGGAAGTAEAAAFEMGRSERVAEGARSEVETLEEEREEERSRTKQERKEREENEEEEGKEPHPDSPTNPGGGGSELEPTQPSAPSVSIHGRNFPGATGSHIAKTGKTPGGKDYVEYAIKFPGKMEHWQYFTASGNWRQVSGSDTGAGANKPGPGNNAKGGHTPTGGPATKPKGGKLPPVAIHPAHPVSGPHPVATAPPPPSPTHPAAVNTGNRCVNGGVGGHTAPPGYHLFCQNVWIYRAPNA